MGMTNYDVVKKLIDDITPIGMHEIDKARLENLKAMCELMDDIHTAIDAVAYNYRNDKQASVKACCDYANEFLNKFMPE